MEGSGDLKAELCMGERGKVCSRKFRRHSQSKANITPEGGTEGAPWEEECLGSRAWASVSAVSSVSLLLQGLSVVGSQNRALETCRSKGGPGAIEQDSPQQSQGWTQSCAVLCPVALLSGMGSHAFFSCSWPSLLPTPSGPCLLNHLSYLLGPPFSAWPAQTPIRKHDLSRTSWL